MKSFNLKSTNTCFFIILGSFFIHLFKLISITNNHCSFKISFFFINFNVQFCWGVTQIYETCLPDFHHSAFTFVNMAKNVVFGFYLQHSLFQTLRACSFAVLTVVQHSIRRAMSNQQVDVFGDVFPNQFVIGRFVLKSTTGGFFAILRSERRSEYFDSFNFDFLMLQVNASLFQLRKNLLSWHLSCEKNTFVIVLSLNFESTFSWFPAMTILCVNFSLSRKLKNF